MPRLLLSCLLLFAAAAHADEAHPVVRTLELTGSRVTLGELVDGLPPSAKSIDLGAVPRPNGSRLLTRAEVTRLLPADVHVALPDAFRLTRKLERWSVAELERRSRAAVVAAVPQGVVVRAVHVPAAQLLPAGFTGLRAVMPRLPHHTGAAAVTVLVEVRQDTDVLQELSVRAELDVGAEAAQPDVTHGSSISAVIARGLVEVMAPGTASTDGDVGDVIPVLIRSTGRTVRARVESKEKARVVEAP